MSNVQFEYHIPSDLTAAEKYQTQQVHRAHPLNLEVNQRNVKTSQHGLIIISLRDHITIADTLHAMC